MISSTIYDKTAQVNIWNGNKLHEPVGWVQFVVIEKLTNVDLSRIPLEKSCDYLLIIYYPNMTLFSSLVVFFSCHGSHSISWKPLRFASWFPTFISCSPNLPRVYIRLFKHGNHFTFLQCPRRGFIEHEMLQNASSKIKDSLHLQFSSSRK